MQFIKRLLKLLILLALVFGVGFAIFSFYLWVKSAEPITSRSDTETRSNVQWLSTEKPLVFSFSRSRTHSIRVLSNAIFSEPTSLDKPINYAIEYTFLNEQKQVISSHIYHHASKLTPPDNNDLQIKQIIEDRQALLVSSGQSFYLSQDQLDKVASISLKLITEDTQVMGVVVRVHAKTLNNSDDKYSAWLKLPLERRERSSAYHSVGVNALSTTEINNAVTYSWLKLAPQGIPGIDFKADILYETLPYNVVTYDFSQQQLNLNDYYTDATLCASITLEQPDSLVFSLNTAGDINLTWYDSSQFTAPKKVNYKETAQPLTFITAPLDSGLVTICSRDPLLSNWSFNSHLPMTTAQDGYYQITESLTARYTIEANSDINIDLRSASRGHASVIVFDQDNQPIDTFTVAYNDEISSYDRVILDSTQREKVPKANQFYLRVNERASALEITTKQPLLVRVKSRSRQFNYQRTLCHSVCLDNLEFHDIAAWYEQQADNHYAFIEQDSYINIRVFQEPPAILIEDTFYQSRELFKQLPISNVALVNSPTKYFAPSTEPTPFHFALLSKKQTKAQLVQMAASAPSTTTANVVYQLNAHAAKEVALKETDFEQLANIENSAQKIYQNWQGQRPWIKQRLYKLTANKPLKLTYPTLRPHSIVLKTYSHNAKQKIIIDVTQNAKYHGGLTHEYSITNKRLQLLPSNLSEAFLIHPKDSQLFAYPAVTQQINADIRALNNVTFTSNKTVWIAILEEYSNEEVKIRWWNDDVL
ncbi:MULTISPECIES: hypothetical protein [unclassified Pseudoalteromonas]|uniref:hypothetical protein n=1 Tax=unclassified Pseudoalteromonas TaxID=194690 RepID=UPI001109A8FF|nr:MULTISPECIES: hypothetical protein [unclassified Pseudoalteromonas]TMN71381.1 hypothetical protein CWB85_11285 [Pseudoalteromonas sp. S1727]BDF93594.1 hypothetical protein KAN5_04320 [Pseudoalteromonas sp. KAN5]